MKIMLAADMHLKPGEQNDQNKKLEVFLEYCQKADRLFLIGDTFNCWFENKNGYAGDFAQVLAIFEEAVREGLEIYLINGNRDFVFSGSHKTPLGFTSHPFQRYFNNTQSVLSKIGVHLQGESAEFTLGGKNYFLIHGDKLCTEDIWHQLLRFFLIGKYGGRLLSSFIPLKFIDIIFRWGSFYHKPAYNNTHEIVSFREVQDEAVAPIIDAGCDLVICGHLHKHIEKDIVGSRRSGKVVVLPCWASGDYAILDNDAFQIKKFSWS